MPVAVTEVQSTPNPNALKYILNQAITEVPVSFFNVAAAAGHPLATRLFEIAGVTSVLFLGDFVTVNKSPGAKWSTITPAVKQVLAAG